MVTLARTAVGNDMDKIIKVGTYNVAPKFEDAKFKFISAAALGMENPHYPESYYLLASKW